MSDFSHWTNPHNVSDEAVQVRQVSHAW